ncbi:DUF5392 family protein (plasmid) [Alkalihalobacillus hwajinpoensis]|uniref:DUF5392 family protein n=1 Tax=Guptibacillus hwajinpoensis TaxID=208199 RepID=UPI001883989D|nr:DUF5392 family protein [Pseudalkalibacillus hwajinpoensis]MBF0706722.1 DUF5392 family protein [Pseudalkalibacillus hwajinpoensis]
MISELNEHLKWRKRYNTLSLIINSILTSMLFTLFLDINQIRSAASTSIQILFGILIIILITSFVWSLRRKSLHDKELHNKSEQFFMKRVIESEYLNPVRKQRYINILENKVPNVNRMEGMVEFFIEEAEQAEHKKLLELENSNQSTLYDET